MIKKISCWECGKEVEVEKEEYNNPFHLKTYDKEWKSKTNKNKREFCKECKETILEEKKSRYGTYLKLKAEFMVDRAIMLMERQNINVYEYKQSIDAIAERFKEDIAMFRSSDEIVAATILIQHGIPIKTNYKIGSYTADIFVSSLSCIIEVDGYYHENDKAKFKDGTKDLYIRHLLGKEWEVVRIPTKYIEKNAENLISAIIELKSKMMQIREQNGGFLPYDFSKTMNAVYNKLLKG